MNCSWGVSLLDRVLVLDFETLRLAIKILDLSLKQEQIGEGDG